MFGKKKTLSLCIKAHIYVHLLSFVHKNTKKHAKTTKNTKKHKKIDHKLEFIRVYALRHWGHTTFQRNFVWKKKMAKTPPYKSTAEIFV